MVVWAISFVQLMCQGRYTKSVEAHEGFLPVQKLSVPVRTFEITSKFGSLGAFALCDAYYKR
jgi:hypothetical protein